MVVGHRGALNMTVDMLAHHPHAAVSASQAGGPGYTWNYCNAPIPRWPAARWGGGMGGWVRAASGQWAHRSAGGGVQGGAHGLRYVVSW